MKFLKNLFSKDIRETKWMSREEFEAKMSQAGKDVYNRIDAEELKWISKRELFSIAFTSGAALAMNMIHDSRSNKE